MSNGDTGRKAHIKRIYKTSDTDVWVDVERIDELDVLIDGGRQRVHYKFDWTDIETKDKKTLTDPHDQDNQIDVPIRASVRLEGPRGVRTHYFRNDSSNQSRKTHSRRVYHHEIKNEYLDGNEPPRDPAEYKQSLGAQDKDEFIDVELLDWYWLEGDMNRDVHGHAARVFRGGDAGSSSVRGQNQQWLGTVNDELLQDPMVENDEAGGDPAFDPITNPERQQIDPPWRLDPLQNIVNVSWEAGLAVEFYPGSS
jgi:hypothetical protein